MLSLGAAIYLLCFATSLVCMILLFRGYSQTRTRLLLWSALCFVGLAINNLLLILDLIMLPDVDLRLVRALTALAAVSILLLGFIWDAD